MLTIKFLHKFWFLSVLFLLLIFPISSFETNLGILKASEAKQSKSSKKKKKEHQ